MHRILTTLCSVAFFLLSTTVFAIELGQPAPELSLSDSSGATTTLTGLRGRVVYLDFWASWCGPCKESLPFMNQLQAKYADKGLTILAVNLDEQRVQANALLKAIDPSFIVLFDPEGVSPQAFSPPTMPTSYLIDRVGVVHAMHRGFKTADRQQIEDEVKVLLGIE